jgi:hypothetical protein
MVHALALAAALAAAPAVSPEVPVAVQLSREVLTPEMWKRTLDGMVGQYAAHFRAMAERNGGTADAGLEGALRKLYEEILPYAELVDLQASLLQKHFSEAELAELRDFYRSPLGAKMRDRMPEIAQDALGLGIQKVEGKMGRIGEALRPHFHMPRREDSGDPPAKPTPSKAKQGAGGSAQPPPGR